MSTSVEKSTTVSIADIEIFTGELDTERAAAIYKEYGCLVVRGLMKPYIEAIARDIDTCAAESVALLPEAVKIPEGWTTPNGTLFLPAPANFSRDKQIMVLGIGYTTSAALFHSAYDSSVLDVAEAILGPNIELFLNGQCLYKEPVGGHPKNLHQDSAYFEHRFEGPVATLNYVVDTDLVNGALYVVPGSHKFGTLKHVDTVSHLGLDPSDWPWERALPITGQAGDSIFFHVRTIHGSQQNHSNKPRPVFIHRYRSSDDFVIISGTTAENREENERKAAEAKKENQHGLMVRGYRAFTHSG